MQVVMTAAGRGTRFQDSHDVPKPFILIEGIPMWERAIQPWLRYGKPVVVMQKEHEKYIRELDFDVEFVFIDGYTEGAAITCMIGAKRLNPDEPVVFVECDSSIEFDHVRWDHSTSGTFTIVRDNPAHSYCELDNNGDVLKIREKEVISPWANTGHYWFSKTSIFLDTVENAITENKKTRGEYYTAPLYNDIIDQGHTVKMLLVDKWHCWGTPKDVEEWQSSGSS
jgi:NDP-sugar pyrophosphorylase family protein